MAKTLIEAILALVFLLLCFAGPIIRVVHINVDKHRIKEYLANRGATDITISRVSIASESNTYDLEYVVQGKQCWNTCIIPASLFGEREIYWKDPL